MNTDTQLPILEGCAVLPPMHQGNGNGSPHRHQGDTSKAKGKPGRRNTADRFAVLNAFVDAGMVGLSRVEIGTWLTLYRDTRNGTACTSRASIAARVGCSVKAVGNALVRLRKAGLLIQVFKGGQEKGPSIYRVWPMPKQTRNQEKPTSLP
jgi:hypothetical protein